MKHLTGDEAPCPHLCYCARAQSIARIVDLENENKRLRILVDAFNAARKTAVAPQS